MGHEVETLKGRLPLLEYLRQQNWNGRRAGRFEYVGLCPLHKESQPSFYVNTRKDVFYCHGCGQGGDSACRKTINRVLFINMKTTATTKHPTVLLATWVTLRILIVLNWIFGALIFGMLAMSFEAAGWTWRAFGVAPVAGHEGMVAGMRAIMVIGIAGTPITYVVFSRLQRIVESVRSGVAFTIDNAGRLRIIAWAMLGLELLHICVVAIASAVSTKEMPLRMNGNLHVTGWLAILMLFVLAQVFLEGTRMREDLEGTV